MSSYHKHQLALGEDSLIAIETTLRKHGFVEASVMNPAALSAGQYIKLAETGGPFQSVNGLVDKAWTVYWLQA
jgi:hypothetical protein